MTHIGYMEALDWSIFDTVTPRVGDTEAILFREPVGPGKPPRETNIYNSGCLVYQKMLVHRLHVMFLANGAITPTRSWPETDLIFRVGQKPYISGQAWQFAHPQAVLLDLASQSKDLDATRRLFTYDGAVDQEILRELAAVYNAPGDPRGKPLIDEKQTFEVRLSFPGGWSGKNHTGIVVFIEGRPFLRPVV